VFFWSDFCAILAEMGALWGAFGETFRHFLGDCELLLDVTPSQAKTYIFKFWRSQVGTSSSTFPGPDFRVCFYAFLSDIL